jgi:PAS domain S-box-containing protein
MSEKRPTYEELLLKLAETEQLLTRLSEKLEAVANERDSALLGTRELEEAYIESEQNFRNSLDACPLGVRIVTEDGELIYANQAILDICGIGSIEELKATPRKQLYTSESYAAHQARKEKRLRGEFVPTEYEIDIRRPDGAVRNLQVFRSEVIWGGERQFMAMYQDITERKRAEESLRESEEKFAKAFHNTPSLKIITTLKEGRIIEINDVYCRVIGYKREELIGHTAIELNLWDDHEQRKGIIEKIKEKGEVTGIEVKLRTKSGEVRTVELSMAKVMLKNESCLLAIAMDITERKKAEEALRESEERFRIASQIASDVVYERDLQTGIATFYGDIDSHLGYEPGGYPRTMEGWREHVHPEDLALIERQSIDQLKPGASYSIEYRMRKKDGTYVTWLDRIMVICDEETGKPLKFIGAATDVTERKKAQEKHQTILKTARDGFWVVDLNGKLLEVNDSYCQMLGYTREELMKMTIKDVEVIENPEETARHIEKIVQQGSDRFETRHRRKDGQIIDFEVSANYLDIAQGQLFVFFHDITKRKQSEERINHLNLTLRSIRSINQLITREKDRDRLIKGVCDSLVETRSFGSAWIVLLDESRQPVAWASANFSSGFPALIESSQQGNLPRCVAKAIKQKKVVVTKDPHAQCPGCPVLGEVVNIGSFTVRLEYGRNIYGILCVSLPKSILSDEDEVSLFQEVATDISFALHNIGMEAEHKLLDQERLRAAKLESIGTLAGGIAHDFNNLLAGIMGNIGLVKTHLKPSEAIFEMLDEAEKAAVRARDLTQQLLTFARGGKPVKKLINISSLIKDAAAFALRGSNVRLELSLPDNLWAVAADEGQIGQAINNLVINADEAMPTGGILRIEAVNSALKRAGALPLPSRNYVRIDIKDTGVGISPEHLQRIFEPYFTTKQKGSGLGLTTAYSIVRNHGGYILAESTLNEGSVFHIYLPASKKTVKGGVKEVVENAVRAGGKILVMDDEEIIRKMLKNMLSLAGYEVELTADGAAALEKYTQTLKSGKPFDAVIMDLTIPGGMGGKEAIKKLLEIDPRATVIVSSGYATDPIMSEYKKYGFKAVIAKPYSVKQLQETLKRLSRKKNK